MCDYNEFSNWLDDVLKEELPDATQAVCFNLYDEEDGSWSVQFIAAGIYDADNDEWPCEEVFSSEENIYTWKQECEWAEAQKAAIDVIVKYLEEGAKAEYLKSYKAVAAGFVDGDLITLWPQESQE